MFCEAPCIRGCPYRGRPARERPVKADSQSALLKGREEAAHISSRQRALEHLTSGCTRVHRGLPIRVAHVVESEGVAELMRRNITDVEVAPAALIEVRPAVASAEEDVG